MPRARVRTADEAPQLSEELRGWVAQQLSPIAKPDDIRFADALPKTRSGKIMRRLLRSIARGEEISQDISTLENPAIVAQLRGEQSPRTAGATRPAMTRSAVAKKTVRTAAIRKAPGKKRGNQQNCRQEEEH